METSKNVKIQDNKNFGHTFEEIVAHSLEEMGHEVSNIIRNGSFPLITTLVKSAINDYINKKTIFSKVEDTLNRQSISADFISDKISISCKSKTNVVKHPSLNRVFEILTGIDRDIINMSLEWEAPAKFLTESITKDEAKKIFKTDFLTTVTKPLTLYIFKFLQEQDLSNVLEAYYFLMGKDKPLIFKAKDDILEVIETSKIKKPKNVSLELISGSIFLHFDNGISLKHRVKTRGNRTAKRKWHQLFKEEWSLIISDKIKDITKTYRHD